MNLWNALTKWLFPYDAEPGMGYGNVKIDESHPFYRAAIKHDADYSDIIAGKSSDTLKQVDQRFLENCLRAAKGFPDPGDAERYRREAWSCWTIVRAWGLIFRGELAAYKPKETK